MGIVVIGYSVLFVLVLAGFMCQQVSPIVIEIIPDEYTAWERHNNISVNITCLFGADHTPITNITELRLYKGDGDPVVRIQNDSQILHDFVNDSLTRVEGQIDPTRDQAFLQLTIVHPMPRDAGSYTCGVTYFDQSGAMKEDNASKTLYVGYLSQLDDENIDIIYILDKYVNVATYTIGILGNILCLLVWIQKDMMSSSGFYLAVLAFNDLSYICLKIISDLWLNWGIHTINYAGWCQIYFILFNLSHGLSSPLALCFTVERYIAICYPFKRVVYCTVRRAKIVVACMVTFMLIINLPNWYFITHISTVVSCGYASKDHDSSIFSVFKTYSTLQEYLFNVVGNIAIAIVNVLVIVKLREDSSHYLQRTRCYNGTSSPRNIIDKTAATSMLLGVSFYQVLTTLPYSITRVLYYYYYKQTFEINATKEEIEESVQKYTEFLFLSTCTVWLATTHYAFDILIYVVTSKPFRLKLKRIMCPSS